MSIDCITIQSPSVSVYGSSGSGKSSGASKTSSTDNPEGPKDTDDAAELQKDAQRFQLAMFGLQNQGDKNKAMIELLKDSSRKIAN